MKFLLAITFSLLAYRADEALAAYKCKNEGKTIYSDQPCTEGLQSRLDNLEKPNPAVIAESLQQSERERLRLKELEQQRAQRDAQYAKQERKLLQEQARKRKACRALERRKRWAEEDAAAASAKSAESAQRKVRRAGELFDEECGQR